MTESSPDPETDIDFNAFVRAHTDALRRFFRKRVAQQSDVDDLVQDVFARLAKRGLKDISNQEAFLFTTAANALRDRIRRRASHHADDHTSLDKDYVSDTDFSPERVLMGKEALSKFEAAFRELPQRTQEVFVLSRFEEWRNAEIARKLDISVSAVEKHITRALVHLAARLEILP